MKILICAFSVILSLGSPAVRAQASPDQVTTEQIATYQAGVERGCKSKGRRDGEVPAKVDEICNCVVEVLRSNVTREQWQQLYFLSVSGRDREEAEVLAPHARQFRSCRK